MARAQYFVVLHDGAWRVKFSGLYLSQYPSQAAAIAGARSFAEGALKRGTSSQVLVQGEDNAFRAEASYGEQPS